MNNEMNNQTSECTKCGRPTPDWCGPNSNPDSITFGSNQEEADLCLTCYEAGALDGFIESELVDIHDQFGRLYSFMQNPEKALHAYKSANSINETAEISEKIAMIYQSIGSIESAIENHERALVLDPNSYISRHNLIVALLKQGDLNKALLISEDAVGKQGMLERELFMVLCEVNYRLGKLDVAETYYKKALKELEGTKLDHQRGCYVYWWEQLQKNGKYLGENVDWASSSEDR